MLDKNRKFIRIVAIIMALIMPIVCGLVFQKFDITFFQNIPQRLGPMAHFNEQIRSDEKDFDIVFFGSSATWSSIDVTELNSQFKPLTGKDLKIINLSTTWLYVNMLYESAMSFLKHRQVKLAVVELSMWENPDKQEHPGTMYFINLFNMWPVLKNLDVVSNFRYYGNSIIGWPRQIVGTLLPNSRFGLTESQQKVHNHYRNNFGSLAKEEGWLASDDVHEKNRIKYKEYFPTIPELHITKILHTGQNSDPRTAKDSFPLTHFQQHMLREIFLAVENRNGKMIFTDPVNDFNVSPYWRSRTYENSLFNNQMIPLVRVANTDLLNGLTNDDLKQMYMDDQHRNKNGANHFTRTIFPAIASAYLEAINEK